MLVDTTVTDSYFTRQQDLGLRLMRDISHDYQIMSRWLSDERVLEFYGGRDQPQSVEQIKNQFRPLILSKNPVIPCLIELQEQPIGYLQYYRLIEDLDEATLAAYGPLVTPQSYAFDIFIGEPVLWNQGLGPKTLNLLATFLFSTCDADLIFVDPQVNNTRAIRAYEKSGFRKLKILPDHEYHEGAYRQCWLMVRKRDMP